MTYDWSKMVKMTVPVGLCGWQQRGSLTINGRTTEFPVGVDTELPEPVAERVKALMADAEEKAEHVQPLKPWMQYVTGADGVARWEPRLAYAETEEAVILPETAVPIVGRENPVTEQFAAPIVDGNTYTFIYNGTAHECVAKQIDLADGVAAIALGNVGAMTGGDDTGEPFAFIVLPPDVAAEFGAAALLTPLDGAESVTLSITGVAEKAKTIDPKFLPAGAGGGGGGGGIIYVQEFSGDKENPSANPCFSDRELTQQMDYATGKAILLSGGWVCQPTEIDGMVFDMYLKPISMFAVDDGKAAQVVLANPNTGEDFVQYHMGLVFSDSEA